jgi:hypothetical protein
LLQDHVIADDGGQFEFGPQRGQQRQAEDKEERGFFHIWV